MGEHTIFECDATGKRFGARNDVFEIGVKRRWEHEPFNVREYNVHLSDDAVDEAPFSAGQLQMVDYVTVEGTEIVGCGINKRDDRTQDSWVEYRQRDDVLSKTYEDVFAYLESEVLV